MKSDALLTLLFREGPSGLRKSGLCETKIQGHLQKWVKGKMQVFPVKSYGKRL